MQSAEICSFPTNLMQCRFLSCFEAGSTGTFEKLSGFLFRYRNLASSTADAILEFAFPEMMTLSLVSLLIFIFLFGVFVFILLLPLPLAFLYFVLPQQSAALCCFGLALSLLLAWVLLLFGFIGTPPKRVKSVSTFQLMVTLISVARRSKIRSIYRIPPAKIIF